MDKQTDCASVPTPCRPGSRRPGREDEKRDMVSKRPGDSASGLAFQPPSRTGTHEAVICASCPTHCQMEVTKLCRERKVMKAFSIGESGIQSIDQWHAQVTMAVVGLVEEREAKQARVLCIREDGPGRVAGIPELCADSAIVKKSLVQAICQELNDATFPVHIESPTLDEFKASFGSSPSSPSKPVGLGETGSPVKASHACNFDWSPPTPTSWSSPQKGKGASRSSSYSGTGTRSSSRASRRSRGRDWQEGSWREVPAFPAGKNWQVKAASSTASSPNKAAPVAGDVALAPADKQNKAASAAVKEDSPSVATSPSKAVPVAGVIAAPATAVKPKDEQAESQAIASQNKAANEDSPPSSASVEKAPLVAEVVAAVATPVAEVVATSVSAPLQPSAVVPVAAAVRAADAPQEWPDLIQASKQQSRGSSRLRNQSASKPSSHSRAHSRTNSRSMSTSGQKARFMQPRRDPLAILWTCQDCKSKFDTEGQLMEHQESEGHWSATLDSGKTFVRKYDLGRCKTDSQPVKDSPEEKAPSLPCQVFNLADDD